MQAKAFLIVYLTGVIPAYGVRIPFVRRANRGAIREDRVNILGGFFFVVSLLGLFVLPFFNLVMWLPGLAYTLPVWAGWVASVVVAMAILLLRPAHGPPAR